MTLLAVQTDITFRETTLLDASVDPNDPPYDPNDPLNGEDGNSTTAPADSPQNGDASK